MNNNLLFFFIGGGVQASEQIQCIACGLPKVCQRKPLDIVITPFDFVTFHFDVDLSQVSPDNDVYGSYGTELGKKR